MDLVRIVKRNPSIAVGVAAFVGLALGAGWLPIGIPSLPTTAPTKPAAPTSASSGPPPTTPDPLDGY